MPGVPDDQVHGTQYKQMPDVPNQVHGVSGEVPDVPEIVPIFCGGLFLQTFQLQEEVLCFVQYLFRNNVQQSSRHGPVLK